LLLASVFVVLRRSHVLRARQTERILNGKICI
jgi:hypothetical protein